MSDFDGSLYRAVLFGCTKAAGADVHSSCRTVVVDPDFSDIGAPGSVGSPVRMGNVVSENKSLRANFTFCHSFYTSDFYHNAYKKLLYIEKAFLSTPFFKIFT